jgi:hypothetical protein
VERAWVRGCTTRAVAKRIKKDKEGIKRIKKGGVVSHLLTTFQSLIFSPLKLLASGGGWGEGKVAKCFSGHIVIFPDIQNFSPHIVIC